MKKFERGVKMNHREKWDKKHHERLNHLEEPAPNKRLKKLASNLQGGKALDVACGLGGNSLFLGRLDYEVLAVDLSEVAINHVREQAAHHGLRVNALNSDLTDIESLALKAESFDLVLKTYYLDRTLFPFVKELVKKNGMFFMETFYHSPLAVEERVSSQYKLNSNELLAEFSDWKILFFEENEQEGRQTILCQKQ